MRLIGKKNYKIEQNVYGVPYGNYARSRGKEILEFKVIKIGNKYAEIKENGRYGTLKCNMIEGQVEGFNAGYYIYENMEEIENERKVEELYKKINNVFRMYGSERKFTLNQLERIYEICNE